MRVGEEPRGDGLQIRHFVRNAHRCSHGSLPPSIRTSKPRSGRSSAVEAHGRYESGAQSDIREQAGIQLHCAEYGAG